jgi:hypothetical protein
VGNHDESGILEQENRLSKSFILPKGETEQTIRQKVHSILRFVPIMPVPERLERIINDLPSPSPTDQPFESS